jgi:hypothetical protein
MYCSNGTIVSGYWTKLDLGHITRAFNNKTARHGRDIVSNTNKWCGEKRIRVLATSKWSLAIVSSSIRKEDVSFMNTRTQDHHRTTTEQILL